MVNLKLSCMEMFRGSDEYLTCPIYLFLWFGNILKLNVFKETLKNRVLHKEKKRYPTHTKLLL